MSLEELAGNENQSGYFFYVGDSKGTGHLEKNFRRGGTGSDLYLRKFTGGQLGMEWEERRVQDQFRG